MTQNHWVRIAVLTSLVVIAALSRLVPHPPNFSPVGAIAIFSGACFASRRLAFIVPFLALVVSDLLIGFYPYVLAVYAAFAVNILMGRLIRNRKTVTSIASASLLGAIQFFVTTNFACWVAYYPKTLEGLANCYVAAVPFFQNSLLGDAVFATVLFGGLALLEKLFPAVQETPALAE